MLFLIIYLSEAITMSDDNVYEIDSVPKFVAFSEMEPLANETIGDKFFVSQLQCCCRSVQVFVLQLSITLLQQCFDFC